MHTFLLGSLTNFCNVGFTHTGSITNPRVLILKIYETPLRKVYHWNHIIVSITILTRWFWSSVPELAQLNFSCWGLFTQVNQFIKSTPTGQRITSGRGLSWSRRIKKLIGRTLQRFQCTSSSILIYWTISSTLKNDTSISFKRAHRTPYLWPLFPYPHARVQVEVQQSTRNAWMGSKGIMAKNYFQIICWFFHQKT